MNSSTAHFLVGRIHHVISSKNNVPALARPCNKRPRPWEAGNTDSPLRDSISAANKDDRRLKGFILECEESSQNFSFHSAFGILFHLVIPLPLIKDACHAAATGKTVQISQYSLIRYRHDGRGELVFDSRESNIVNYEKDNPIEQENVIGTRSIIVAEVHRCGLTIHAPGTGDEADSTGALPHKKIHEKLTVPTLTLEMLSCTEQLQSKIRKGSKSKSLSKKEPMSITAVVDAVSPILVDDTFGQPFALMELYQPDSAPVHSAVAVLRGENALCMHAAILPGQRITLMGVISRSWKVPEAFRHSSTKINVPEDDHGAGKLYQRLYRRTPDRVILVEEAHSVHLNDKIHDEVPPLPSTVESLTSIRGVVDSIHFYRHDDICSKNTEHIIHFVTIKNFTQQCTFHDNREDYSKSISSDSNGNQLKPRSIATINLLKYSFSPHVLLGLQPGAVIRAVNVHCINSLNNTEECYVGCLRSTVTIERCAGDTNDCSNCPWFIPNVMPFVLLPHHQIADIGTGPCKSVPTSQFIEEQNLRIKVKSIIGESASVTQQIRILLAHHHKIGITNNNARSAHKKTTPMRDPYAEFFDHAHSDRVCLEYDCGSFAHKNFSTFCFDGNASLAHSNMLNVVRLDVLRDVCAQNFIRKMATFCNIQSGPSRVSSGWTSSHHYYSSKVYVWGKVEFDRSKPELRGSVGVVYGDTCRIPLSVAFEKNMSIAVEYYKNDFLGWLQVKSVLVSCICLGCGIFQDGSESAGNDDSRRSAEFLPHTFLPCAMANCEEDSILGHVFIFCLGSSIFIGCIHFIVIPVRPELVESPSNKIPSFEENALSIQRCLEQTGEVKESSPSIIGRLTRQRFQFRKMKLASDRCTECYEGWTICLSNIDHSQEDILSTSSILQTIDVHVSVPVGRRRSSETDSTKSDFMKYALQTALTDLVISGGSNVGGTRAGPLCRVSSDQLTMALAFWHASERNGIQPVLSGGWESCNNRLLAENKTSSTYQSFSVYVVIPLTSRAISKLGYQRFRCNLDDLLSFTVLETFHIAESSCYGSSQFVDFSVNTGKFLPGMLSRGLRRVKPFTGHSEVNATTSKVKGGKVIKNPYTALTTLTEGVPSATLADLHWDICRVLSERQPSRLNPSLLRRIRKAKVLGISFCRAQVECTQCFQFFISSRSEDGTLLCPTGCRSVHAAVKWECSALIDDGTGQAKLYAEREAALLLLGNSLDVAAVEEGAWMCQDGVFFQPALPPSSYLRRSIREASMEARNQNTQKRQDTKAAYTYNFLTPLAKAEYLLQHHCRQWYQKHHHLKLDLFCRCKPLSIDVTTVNRTEIQVAKAIDGFGLDFGTAQTTSLPPLKLILQDIAVASEDNQDERWAAWDMLREIKSPEAHVMI